MNHTLSPWLRLVAFRGVGKMDLRPHRESSTEIFLHVNQRFALAFVSGGGRNRDVVRRKRLLIEINARQGGCALMFSKMQIQVGEERR
ncbi:MAG TPA: hypothetical protein VF778_10525 [Xanthobacteraceae bacterium]